MIDYNTSTLYNRRTAIFLTGSVFLTSLLVIRMMHLQIFNYDMYLEKAKNNSFKIQIKTPLRGEILSIKNEPISKNIPIYRVYIIPEEVVDLNLTIELLKNKLKISENNYKIIKKRLKKQIKFQPFLIQETDKWKILAELQAQNIQGVYFENSFKRYYELEEAGAQIFGYVKTDKNNLFLTTGVTGLEKAFDKELSGKIGQTAVITNASGRVVSEDKNKNIEAINGNNIKTTIDINLQKKLFNILSTHKSGCGVVLDIKTGNILSIASVPSFNPNKFQLESGEEYINSLRKNIYKPFINKTIEGLYPPGSIFKIVVALAALETGAITPFEKINCKGFWDYKDRRYHCWKHEGHGYVDLIEALKYSCDTYFYQIALKIGIDTIRDTAIKLGFLEKFFEDIFPKESTGIIPNKKWKTKKIGINWLHGDTILSGIGQGFILSNCLQNAIMLARVTSNKQIIPNIIYDKKDKKFNNLNFDNKNIKILLKALEKVTKEGGTAYNANINIKGKRLGGKTGTSQVRNISKKERETGLLTNEQILWNKRNHGLFVGYAPTNNPKYIISIITEHSGTSSTASKIAAEVIKDIL